MNPLNEPLRRQQKRLVYVAWALLWLSIGFVLAMSVRPAEADGSDEIHRSREALESIATTLKRCAK